MYDSIGEKIQGLAKFFFAIGLIFSIIGAIVMIGMHIYAAGVILLIVGPLASWISTLCLYGFGELIVQTNIIVWNTNRMSNNIVGKTPVASTSERGKKISELEKLREEGLISEEEYLQEISKGQ